MAGNDYVRLAAACCGGFKFAPLSRRTPRGPFTCGNCGVSYTTIRKKGEGERFCSRDCAFAFKAAEPKFCAYFAGHCVDCGLAGAKTQRWLRCAACVAAHQSRKAHAKGRAAHSAEAKVTACAQCRTQFCPLYGHNHARLCQCCSEDRRKQHKAVSRLKRKAAQRSVAVESVNPLRVFERDGWRCQLCKRQTPRKLRGTLADRAPELDHILPLGRGGEHSYRNTQCACRACNAAKSDKPMGQMLLIG